ncbi:hypothetical protein MC378_14110 [Polaribacter sp. MSW13]|uniref:Uncharacterized protein n=1 Tax=Polaribacter marinus TaxID=2916838 RepID=A0A9X2ANV2_9FLAO|nr:hypothetical protein [Polaribacter marinus]MCI2230309.1 hypothetical protein [Polaribacter marinus]
MEEQQTQKREEAIKDMKMYLANDWNLKEETPEYFLLTRNTASTGIHILLALFFWFIAFIPNIIYHYSKKEKKKILK